MSDGRGFKFVYTSQNKKQCRDAVGATSPITWFGEKSEEHNPLPAELGDPLENFETMRAKKTWIT